MTDIIRPSSDKFVAYIDAEGRGINRPYPSDGEDLNANEAANGALVRINTKAELIRLYGFDEEDFRGDEE